MASEQPDPPVAGPPVTGSPPVRPRPTERDAMRGKDWVVAIGIGLVLVLIVAAIFRNGLAYMYGVH